MLYWNSKPIIGIIKVNKKNYYGYIDNINSLSFYSLKDLEENQSWKSLRIFVKKEEDLLLKLEKLIKDSNSNIFNTEFNSEEEEKEYLKNILKKYWIKYTENEKIEKENLDLNKEYELIISKTKKQNDVIFSEIKKIFLLMETNPVLKKNLTKIFPEIYQIEQNEINESVNFKYYYDSYNDEGWKIDHDSAIIGTWLWIVTFYWLALFFPNLIMSNLLLNVAVISAPLWPYTYYIGKKIYYKGKGAFDYLKTKKTYNDEIFSDYDLKKIDFYTSNLKKYLLQLESYNYNLLLVKNIFKELDFIFTRIKGKEILTKLSYFEKEIRVKTIELETFVKKYWNFVETLTLNLEDLELENKENTTRLFFSSLKQLIYKCRDPINLNPHPFYKELFNSEIESNIKENQLLIDIEKIIASLNSNIIKKENKEVQEILFKRKKELEFIWLIKILKTSKVETNKIKINEIENLKKEMFLTLDQLQKIQRTIQQKHWESWTKILKDSYQDYNSEIKLAINNNI